MNKDWTGNYNSIYATLGASNHTENDREKNDYYATAPEAIDHLIFEGGVQLPKVIWEPCCGEGHLAKRLEEFGYTVISTDLINRGYGIGGCDFFRISEMPEGCHCILTNPPYKYAQEMIEHALNIMAAGDRLYFFLKIQFLEGKSRRKLFEKKHLKTVYVSSSRISCAMNGDFARYPSSAVAYAWYEFEKGYGKEPVIRWIN